jgi:hypothetical protein
MFHANYLKAKISPMRRRVTINERRNSTMFHANHPRTKISLICSIGFWQLLIALALFAVVSILIPRQASAQGYNVYGELEARAQGVSGENINRGRSGLDEFPPWNVSDEAVAGSNLLNSAWCGYCADLHTAAIGSFSYAMNWEVDHGLFWSAAAKVNQAFMETYITVNLPAGKYPDGAPVKLHGQLAGFCCGGNPRNAYVHWSARFGNGVFWGRVEATPEGHVFRRSFVLEPRLLNEGTELEQPRSVQVHFSAFLQTLAGAGNLFFNISDVNCAIQFYDLEVPEGATWTDASEVFLKNSGTPNFITATAGSGGSISPSPPGGVMVVWKGSQTFTIKPNPGFHIADVIVDGTESVVNDVDIDPVTGKGRYTFTDVTSDHTIHAIFEMHTISVVPRVPIGPSPIVGWLAPASFPFSLRQNINNPFNPDTWIPYTLGDDVDVVIRIHNSVGQLVRTLQLGHQPAGSYLTKGKAAYWDGRNEAGEIASSGIYFYTIRAGDFTATKKMLLCK